MAGEKISALPPIVTPQVTDIFPVAQAGVTYKETVTQLATLLNSNLAFLPLAGGTMSGAINMGANQINNMTDPTLAQDAATKNYVDTVASGLNVLPAVYAASTAPLTVTYANGAAGVGATLTNAGAQVTFAIDSVTPPLNSRILIKDQAAPVQNGIYKLTNVGSGSTNWVLTRATDYDTPAQINPGDFVLVDFGTINSATGWIETDTVTAIGTDPISFSSFGAGIYARKGANADITSMSALTGYLQAPLGIKDANGNIIEVYNSIPSAVNYIGITNASTGGFPALDSNGTDSAVPFNLQTKNSNFYFTDTTHTIAPAIRLYNAASTHFTGFKAATAQSTDLTLVVPATDGTAQAPLVTDGSGTLSFNGIYTNFTPAVTGFSGTPTVSVARAYKLGTTCFIQISISGTSNAVTFTFSLPFVAATTIAFTVGRAIDNNTFVATPVYGILNASSNICTFAINDNANGWTASNTKAVVAIFFYETV